MGPSGPNQNRHVDDVGTKNNNLDDFVAENGPSNECLGVLRAIRGTRFSQGNPRANLPEEHGVRGQFGRGAQMSEESTQPHQQLCAQNKSGPQGKA